MRPMLRIDETSKTLAPQEGGFVAERPPARDELLAALEEHGFEPRADGNATTLANCPFHALAQEHTDLVCGMNLQLLEGLLEAVPGTGWAARLAPTPDRCCVRLEPAASGDGGR